MKGKLKAVISLIMVAVLFFAGGIFVGKFISQKNIEKASKEKISSDSAAEKASKETITFDLAGLNSLMAEVQSNELAAENKYANKRVRITVKLEEFNMNACDIEGTAYLNDEYTHLFVDLIDVNDPAVLRLVKGQYFTFEASVKSLDDNGYWYFKDGIIITETN